MVVAVRFAAHHGLKSDIAPSPRSAQKATSVSPSDLQWLELIRWSRRVLASPSAHGTDNRAEVATLGGKNVLGPRGTHRIEPPLHYAILLKRLETLRQRR